MSDPPAVVANPSLDWRFSRLLYTEVLPRVLLREQLGELSVAEELKAKVPTEGPRIACSHPPVFSSGVSTKVASQRHGRARVCASQLPHTSGCATSIMFTSKGAAGCVG